MNALWPASSLLVGLAAWQPIKRASALKDHSLRVVIVPVVCGVGAVGLLTYDHFSRLNGLTVTLAGVTLLLVLVRTALVFVENQRVLAHSRREALTDPLTGLRNRRSLMADLEDQLPRATPEQRVALVLFDLDGFKEYNDAFGHPAGDGLLMRLGERLADAVQGHGRAYRLGGDEFCVVLHPGAGRPGRAGGRLRRGAGRARRGLRRDDLARGRRGARWRSRRPPRRCRSPTGACTPARATAAYRPAASRATCCCAACPSASPTCTCTCAAPPTWRWRWVASSAWPARSWTTWPRRPSCTTSARSPSPTPSWRSRARSTRPSGASCAATRSSASASCWPRPRCAAWRAWCARATSAGTARATRTGYAARRSRSGRAWWPPATPSTR